MTDWVEVQKSDIFDTHTNKKRRLFSFFKTTITEGKNKAINKARTKKSPYHDIAVKFIDLPKSFKLTTTGASQSASDSYRVENKGRLKQVSIDFPIGSHYLYKVKMTVDGATLFQDLRGNAGVKTFSNLITPIHRDSVIEMEMITDDSLKSATSMSCHIDFVIEVDNRK